MDADGLPLVGPGIDYTRVEAIQQKRTIAFINHFISHTASFLNRFSCVCEEKLELMSNRLQQLEISMSILEAKLSSIPGLENITVAQNTSSADTSTTLATVQPATQTTAVTTPAAPSEPEAAAAPAEEKVKPQKTVSQDPRYSKFFKMLQVGVPAMALRNKMLAEGLNPDLIDTPDAPAPDGGDSSGGGAATAAANSDSDDFSDKSSEPNSDNDDFSD
ncbi:WASH complex subunit 3-like [Gigantopelta aegis]|uniref:WASH complex subunit 3-like n=1 Tax=Gigantopelta aegis TaxID=1735272 RepID=UPI001B88E5AC|nr:WASH complex subunit 3-like [Gigantopelta aegis]